MSYTETPKPLMDSIIFEGITTKLKEDLKKELMPVMEAVVDKVIEERIKKLSFKFERIKDMRTMGDQLYVGYLLSTNLDKIKEGLQDGSES
jgi:hypothetical protein